MVKLYIDGHEVEAREGQSVLEAALAADGITVAVTGSGRDLP